MASLTTTVTAPKAVCKYCGETGHSRIRCAHLKVEHDAGECEVCKRRSRRNVTKKSDKSFYSSARYWEERYSKAKLSEVGVERNEWFVDFELLKPSFLRFLPDPPADLSFLDVGCG